jgi:cellulose synthase/poly-beta-1,6-N-acetylglucosamine synthase-like glycosyltransferase
MTPQQSQKFEASGDTSRARLRTHIAQSAHPELIDINSEHSPLSLRNGDPFPFVIAIIPAYNEQESIVKTVDSLRSQTRPPDEIIVLADNCTDDTVALSLTLGVSVVESTNNEDGKAGALNQLLDEILPILDDDDAILVMDADTVLAHRFVQSTVNMLFGSTKKKIAGVGGIFLADDSQWSMVRQLQSNEYVRYQRRLSRRRGRALVLTGTGTVFRVSVLRAVKQARKDGKLPDFGKAQGVYDISALTEDNELTISVKELGYRVVSPKDCTVKTAMMPDLKSLFKQRRRWQRGALENIIAHRINSHTAPYLIRQVGTYLGVLFLPFYVYTLIVALVTQSDINFLHPLWVTVAVVYLIEQTFSVRKGGFRAILVSLAIIPEILLNIFLNIIYVITFFGALFATNESWGRMRHMSHIDDTEPSAKDVTEEISLHGTHLIRQTLRARQVEILLAVTAMIPLYFAVTLPLNNLQLAWNVIALYVLAGFIATLGRLLPVKTF